MKKVTRKFLASHEKIIAVGYCNLQFLLRGHEAKYYSSGIFGKDCEAYVIGDILLITGYRPVTGTIKVDMDIIHDYEKKARKICEKYSFEVDERNKELNELLKELLKTVC